MTKDEFLTMARAAGFHHYDMPDVDGQDLGQSLESDGRGSVERLVAALASFNHEAVQAERTRCANLCRKVAGEDAFVSSRETNSILRSRFEYGALVADECATRILLANVPKDTP